MDTGIIIIALLVRLRSVPQHRNTTAMIRQVVKGLVGIGAHHPEHPEVIALMLLVRHARHRKHGTAMIRHHAKELGGIGANLLVQQLVSQEPDGVQLHHAHLIHAINHQSIIVMTKHRVKELEEVGARRNTEEVVGVHHMHVL